MKKRFETNSYGIFPKLVFVLTGIMASLWFLVRVLQKPSRITYPCMRATAPVMSGFLIYLAGISGLTFVIKKTRNYFRNSNYTGVLWMSLAGMIAAFFTINAFTSHSSASSPRHAALEISDVPVGSPKGYWAGRVTWVMDKDATEPIPSGDNWYQHTNQQTVRTMLANGIMRYADTSGLSTAWNCLFCYFNETHGKGWKGYTTGEKIVVKLNTTNLGAGGHSLGEIMNSTPELVLALLEELIDTIGVAQSDITIGDPFRGFPDQYWDICHTKYPDVHYVEGSASAGREQTTVTSQNLFFTSDNKFASRLPSFYITADYLINMPCLKSHNSAGITLAAKSHQGSVIGTGQTPKNQLMVDFLHYDYPDQAANQKMGIYRHIVDYMAHSKLGGNTLVYIVDGIWAGRNWNGFVDKFGMPPFNDDYPSSLFVSQDPVAIESVGYDFLYEEYFSHPELHDNDDFPLWEGVSDYIHQAADPSQWPAGISYDPDHADHSHPVSSLGVFEHWNNAEQKQYSVNLTGEKGGIELVGVPADLVASVPLKYTHETGASGISNQQIDPPKVYPNPSHGLFNISYNLSSPADVEISLITLNGRLIRNLPVVNEGPGLIEHQVNLDIPAGIYICKIKTSSKKGISSSATRIVIR